MPTIHIIDDIGGKVKVFRRACGMTQKQLAQRAGVHVLTISRIESHKREGSQNIEPDFGTIKKLFSALGKENFELHIAIIDKNDKLLGKKTKW